MGKASREKRQKELQAESISKDKPLEAGKTSAKKSLYRNPFLHLILITIIGFLIYSNTFYVPFQFDDTPNIVENYKLRDLINFWTPSESRWFGFLTFALNYHFGGLDTIGYHIANLIIHVLNAILIYWLVVLTFRTPYFSKIAQSPNPPFSKGGIGGFERMGRWGILIALFSALLFVSHPIQTQAVTYIVQRVTSLATMFYLLSIVTYIKSRLSTLYATRYTLYAVSLISAVLAMKTKEISFTLPVIIMLYEFMFFAGKIKRRILCLIPILLTMLIIPLSMIGIDKPIGDAIGELREAAQETEEISRLSYLFTQFRVIVTYIRLLFLPINQNLDYDYPIYNSFFDVNVFLSFLFLLSIFSLGIYLLYRSRHTNSEPQMLSIPTRYTLHATRLIAFGIFWFFITLSVESSIIPIRDVIFEHRVYLPSIGIIIAFSTALLYYIPRFTPHTSRFSLTTVYLLLTTVVFTLSIATYQRNTVWQEEISLWEDVVRKSTDKPRGHYELGNAYSNKSLIDKAVEHYQFVLRLKSDYTSAHNNLGIAYYKKGWIDEAIKHYQIALKLQPEHAKLHNNLGIAYQSKGLIEKAIEHYQIALRLKPDFAEAHYNLGNTYSSKDVIEKAIEHYQIALRLKPDFADAYYNLGKAYEKKGLLNEAIKAYQMVLKLNPKDEEARNNLNRIFQMKTD